MWTRRRIWLAAALLLSALAAQAQRGNTGLDKYVQAYDPTYAWELVTSFPGQGYQAFLLTMTSQTWRTAAEVDRPVWKHRLMIVRPEKVTNSTAFVFITGGSFRDKPLTKPDPFLTTIATATGSVAATLYDIPNEPLVFADEKKPRTEDEIIAYTWVKYLKTGDETWPLRLPMTKAAVRAMDTITAFCAGPQAGGVKVDKFFVSGGSKRGWTTWTTAAVDARVAGIAPLVIDLLNIIPSFEHHYRTYGFFAPAVKDYEAMGLMEVGETGGYRALMKLVEPYSYRERYTMPKYLVNSAGDQFFLPDSSQFYFDDLPGEKYLRYVPNTDHSLKDSDARESLLAYYDAFLRGTPRPRFSWRFERNGAIRVACSDTPSQVKLWQATNPKARDFRLESIGPAYASRVLPGKDGIYVAQVPRPASGWTAFFVELTYRGGGKYPLKFTTAVRVLPEVLPFRKYRGSGKLPD